MTWIKTPDFQIRLYDESAVESIVKKVKEFTDEVRHVKVVRSANLTERPRVTALSFYGRDFLLSEETYPFGHEGMRVGATYKAKIYCLEGNQEPWILYDRLRDITKKALELKGTEATA